MLSTVKYQFQLLVASVSSLSFASRWTAGLCHTHLHLKLYLTGRSTGQGADHLDPTHLFVTCFILSCELLQEGANLKHNSCLANV